MKILILTSLIVLMAGVIRGQEIGQGPYTGQQNSRLQGKFVWDLLKPALTASEVQIILASREATSYPQYNGIPQTGFSCASKAQAGFYADVDTQCQIFHRCDLSGDQTSYLCVNSTVFNQITLVCDSWFNVDCQRSLEYENFANSRLYTNLPLFDTPPADYISPAQLVLLQNQGLIGKAGGPPAASTVQSPLPVQQQQQQKIIVRRQ